jgi:AcrR family transcriptional regulator
MTNVRPGRPRSEQARRAVLEAAGDLMSVGGYEALSMEGIAARAGVGKQTLYRWWPSKAAIVAEAALDGTMPLPQVLLLNSGDLRADLTEWLRQFIEAMQATESVALVRALAAAVSADDEASHLLYDQFTSISRHALIERLLSAADDGQVRPDADIAAAADVLLSVNLFIVLARDPHTAARATDLLDIVLNGVASP